MMDGEFLIRVTIWLALLGYFAGPMATLLGRSHRPWQRLARLLYSLGLVFFLIHIAAAFHFAYRWSHQVALAETARETFAATGRQSGAGLYLNYLFTGLYIVDVIAWWRQGLVAFRQRPRWLDFSLHGFFIFMAFNATVIFEEGPVRWAGVVFSLILLWALLVARFRNLSLDAA